MNSTPPTIGAILQERGVTEVLHFTHNKGLTGILAEGRVLSRTELPNALRASDVQEVVWEDRTRDRPQHGYVNLSISAINRQLLSSAEARHRAGHDYNEWFVLSFDAQVLTHPGVLFVTTNNIYSGAVRGDGPDAMDCLFAPTVHQFLRNYATRGPGRATNLPTCDQAEALYPHSLGIEYLRTVYVRDDNARAAVVAWILALCEPPIKIDIVTAREVFTG